MWETYVCEQTAGNRLDPLATPQRRWSNSLRVKGTVVMLHGYTASPQAYNNFATLLENSGYNVYSFLTVGHGRKFKDCNKQGAVCVGKGDPIEELPLSRNGYIQFVQRVNSIMKNELTVQGAQRMGPAVHIVGLSLGAALATFAMADAPGFYQRSILFAPFYGITKPDLDRQFQTFIETELPNALSLPASFLFDKGQEGLRRVVFAMTEKPSLVPASIQSKLNSENSWGEQCEVDRQKQQRSGYCSMQVKHLFGVSAMGYHAISNANKIQRTQVQFVVTERDGITRNGLIWNVARAIQASTVTACMFRLNTANCPTVNNTCGVPHSMLSPADNMGITPFGMYWERDLLQQSLDYFDGKLSQIGVTNWNGRREVCEIQSISNPNPQLVLL